MESVSQTEGALGSQNLPILQARGKCGISRGFPSVLQDLEILSTFSPSDRGFEYWIGPFSWAKVGQSSLGLNEG